MREFGASIDFDIALLDADIEGSAVWAEALAGAGLLTPDEAARITAGLAEVKRSLEADLAEPGFRFDRSLEDVHMTVEARLTALIGDLGAKLHTGRSRNDQVALDERLYLFRAVDRIRASIRRLQAAVVEKAEAHLDSFVPSYTHLQQAQPVRLGHSLMAWFWMLERDQGRLLDSRKRADLCPLGSGAVAGSGFPVDRAFIAERLGFSMVSENSIDAVSDRDYLVEFLSACAVLMMHLSRMAEDLVIWSSTEFGFVRIADEYATGSSMMPQKKNPDSLELIRGKTGRVYGNLVALLTVLKGLPFSYCRDLQEDKEPLFDTVKTVAACLGILEGTMRTLEFRTDRMESVIDPSVFATDVADYLTSKGLPFRKAHEVAGRLVSRAQEEGVALDALPLDVYREHSALFEADVADLFDLGASTGRRNVPGGTGRDALRAQTARANELMKKENG
jgi:argininosuccinate lyase